MQPPALECTTPLWARLSPLSYHLHTVVSDILLMFISTCTSHCFLCTAGTIPSRQPSHHYFQWFSVITMSLLLEQRETRQRH